MNKGEGPATQVRIDRIRLRAAGLDEEAAHRLAELVARGLAAGEFRTAASIGLDSLSVPVKASAADGSSPDLLARRIVGEIGRVLARDRVFGGPDGEVSP